MSDKSPEEIATEDALAAFEAACPPMPAGGRPAACVGDLHLCPLVDGVKPHVGGPILPPGVPTVLIAGRFAAPANFNPVTCASAPDTLVLGSMTVLVGGAPLVRMGDTTGHGGMVTTGVPTVLVGG